MNLPRILLAATASGSGKTMITCGILQALVNRGIKVASFKCGPDYIDPMFHSKVIGTKSANLDTFFSSEKITRHLLMENFKGSDLAVMEGVMGYYDGIAGISTKASAYDLAKVTDTPVILIVNCRGMSLSLAACIQGFLHYRMDSRICGIILNQMSPMLYKRMKNQLEEELKIPVFGYVPRMDDCTIESRHLGLVLPEEVPQLKERLHKLANKLEETLDMEAILQCAQNASQLSEEHLLEENPVFQWKLEKLKKPIRIGLAEDEAFCFFYKDNLRLLQNMGAQIVPFSPLHDVHLPKDLDGILLYGGYPELHGQKLEENKSMRHDILEALKQQIPCLAECGGFMYLHETMEDLDGKPHQMIGYLKGKVYHTGKLSRFGYITLEDPILGQIPAHEFHYYDSENCGTAMHASKPQSHIGWDCMHRKERVLAGFPHLYYYGNPKIGKYFLEECMEYRQERER